MDCDNTATLVDQVREASARGVPLRIVGGDTKRFYGRAIEGLALETREHGGILRHDPAELVLTARAGTSLAEIEAVLAGKGQRLPFEPPHFGPCATLGGTVTGEHGVGVEKLGPMCTQFGADELEAFHALKRAFDPDGLLNPGKAIPTLARCADYGAMRVHGGRLPFPHLPRF